MKQLLVILLAVLAASCSRPHSKNPTKIDSLPRPDTVIVAYALGGSYQLARAVRAYSKQPKITDSSSKRWDWEVDTSYTIEMTTSPLDTLRDSLRRAIFDPTTKQPIFRKSFSTTVHSPLPAYFWPLLPPPDHILPSPLKKQ